MSLSRAADRDFVGSAAMKQIEVIVKTRTAIEECASCRFANIHEKGETYSCRRRAPQRFDLDLVLDALRSVAISLFVISERERCPVDGIMDITGLSLDYMSRWPTVSSYDWCGEYEPRKTRCKEPPNVEHRVDLTDLRKTIGRLYGVVKDMERDAE
jgi:hypothetical protein